MQNPSYAYDGLSPSYASLHAIALGTLFDRYKSQNSERICVARLLSYMYLSATSYQTLRTECCLTERNSAHIFISLGGNKPTARHVFVRHTQRYLHGK